MRATRAYIASAGTAAVLLGASVCTFVMVSAFVAFGSWPGTESHTNVDAVILRDAVQPKPQKVAVRADAVVVAERAAKREAIRQRQTRARTAPRTVAGNAVTVTPATPGVPAGTATPNAGAQTPAAANPVAPVTTPVKKQAGQVVQNTTQQVTNGVQKVQDQVNEVVGGIGGPQVDAGGTVQGVTNGVKDAAGSLLGG